MSVYAQRVLLQLVRDYNKSCFRYHTQQAGKIPLLLLNFRNVWSREQPGGELAGSLFSQIQKKQIKKGWDDWTLLYSMVCPLYQAAQSLWYYLYHLSRTPLLECHTHKRIWCTTKSLERLSIYFLKEWDSPFDSPHRFKKKDSLSKYVITVKASVMYLILWKNNNWPSEF